MYSHTSEHPTFSSSNSTTSNSSKPSSPNTSSLNLSTLTTTPNSSFSSTLSFPTPTTTTTTTTTSSSSSSSSSTSSAFLCIRVHTIEGSLLVLPLQSSTNFQTLISKLATLCTQYTKDNPTNALWLLPDGSLFNELAWNTYMSEKTLTPSLPDLPLFVYPLTLFSNPITDASLFTLSSSSFSSSTASLASSHSSLPSNVKIQSKAWSTLLKLEQRISQACQPSSEFLSYIQTLQHQLEKARLDLHFLEKLNLPSSLYPGYKQTVAHISPSSLKELPNRIQKQLELSTNFRNQLQTLSDRFSTDFLPTKPSMNDISKSTALSMYAIWLLKGFNYETQAKQLHSSIQRTMQTDFSKDCLHLHRLPSSLGASLGECLRRYTWETNFLDISHLIEQTLQQWKSWEKQRRRAFEEQVACYLPLPLNLDELSHSAVREDLVQWVKSSETFPITKSSDTLKAVLFKYLQQIEHSSDEFDLVYQHVKQETTTNSSNTKKSSRSLHQLIHPLEQFQFEEKDT